MEVSCPNCDESLTAGASFCNSCGTQLAKKSSRFGRTALILASLLIPLVGWGFALKYLFTVNRRKFGMILGVLGSLSVIMWISIGTSNSPPPKLTVAEIAEAKARSIELDYDTLYRNIETHEGKVIHFQGEVVQVIIKGEQRFDFRVAMNGEHDQMVFLRYSGNRVLDGDIIEVWGSVEGLHSYKSVLGATITIPDIESLHAEIEP